MSVLLPLTWLASNVNSSVHRSNQNCFIPCMDSLLNAPSLCDFVQVLKILDVCSSLISMVLKVSTSSHHASSPVKLSSLSLQASWCAWTFSQMPWNASTMLRSVGNARSSSDPALKSLCASWPSWWSTVRGLVVRKQEIWEPLLKMLSWKDTYCLTSKMVIVFMLWNGFLWGSLISPLFLSRLHWRVWDYRRPQSRENCRQSQWQAEQGERCISCYQCDSHVVLKLCCSIF